MRRLAFVALVLSLSASCGGDDQTAEDGGTSTASGPAEASTSPEQEAPQTTTTSLLGFDDGTHRIGSDIQPDTYVTEGESGCYWARLSGFSGDLDDIIANENPAGQAIVTVAASDAGFESKRCGRWTPLSGEPRSPARSFSEGTQAVGIHITPGTYRSSGGEGCYLARLSGFSGELEHVLANDNTGSPTVVSIAATDIGFTSTRCGTWSAG